MELVKSWIPNLTNISKPIECYATWYGGWAMKVLMKKHHGYPLKTLSMHQTCGMLSTTVTHRNWVLLPCYEIYMKVKDKGTVNGTAMVLQGTCYQAHPCIPIHPTSEPIQFVIQGHVQL